MVVRNAGAKTSTRLSFKVREARSGKLAGQGSAELVALDHDGEQTVEARIPIRNCRLWSPEDPFLYELEASTEADTCAHAVWDAGVSPGPRVRPRGVEWPDLFSARQQRDALPVL